MFGVVNIVGIIFYSFEIQILNRKAEQFLSTSGCGCGCVNRSESSDAICYLYCIVS